MSGWEDSWGGSWADSWMESWGYDTRVSDGKSF